MTPPASSQTKVDIRLANVLAHLAFIDDVNVAIPKALFLMRQSIGADWAYIVSCGQTGSAQFVHADPRLPVGSHQSARGLSQSAVDSNTPEFVSDCASNGSTDFFWADLGVRSKAILPIVLPAFTGALVFAWKRPVMFDDGVQAYLLAMLGYFRLTLKNLAFDLSTRSSHPLLLPLRSLDNVSNQASLLQSAPDAATILNDLQKSQDALRESEDRLRLALASDPQGIFDFDPRTDKVSLDDYIGAACGIPSGQRATWKIFLDAIHPDDVDIRNKAFEAACDPAGSGEYITEYRTIGIADHVVRTVSLRAEVHLGGSARQPVRIVGTLRDVSALRNEEQQLLRANLDLRQFAYAAAHDLQEPLRNVSLILGVLEESAGAALTGSQREWLHEAAAGASRMRRMIKDLLLYTNVSRARHDGSLSDASHCLELALQNLSASVVASGARIHSDPLPRVPISEDHLVLLFENLISNAIKFAKPDHAPLINIDALPTKSHWHFSIADSGIGFNPIYAARIFGVFKRLNARDAYSGNGIGLAICARIVQANGGQMWAEGKLDEGATFHFTLPFGAENPHASKNA